MALGWAWVLGRRPLVQKHEEVKLQTGDCAFWNITGRRAGGGRAVACQGPGLWYVQGVLWSPGST